ncbi:MAG: hypothetical protein SCALA702_15630 [Melioribacteraceae bacterium]|nr:MAG: hypothetical protein SCALA702_15630 [Melioribacteraceae bacterium]
MKRSKYFILVILLLVTSCDMENLIPPTEGELVKLEIDSPDSITLNSGDILQMEVRGVYVVSNTDVITNTGILQSNTYYNQTNDSSFVEINPATVAWYSGDQRIARVNSGLISAVSVGSTYIYAKKENVVSQKIDLIIK